MLHFHFEWPNSCRVVHVSVGRAPRRSTCCIVGVTLGSAAVAGGRVAFWAPGVFPALRSGCGRSALLLLSAVGTALAYLRLAQWWHAV